MNDNLYCQFLLNSNSRQPLIRTANGPIWHYNAIDAQVARYCHYLSRLGIKPGDRLIQQTEKSIDALLVYLAALRCGIIYTPLNPAFKKEELAYFISDAEPTLIVCTPDNRQTIATLLQTANLKSHIETLAVDGQGSLQQQIKSMATTFTTQHCQRDDIAVILYTSGTTGRPKGAMLSHGNLAANSQALKNCWGFTAQDRLLHVLPIFHCHGLFFACHCVLLSGASMIMLDKFNVEQIIRYLPESSVMMGVPTYYTRLLADNRFTKSLTHHMRLFTSGSAPLTEKVFYQFNQRIGQKILERYGMTETGINSSNPLNGERIAGSVGKALTPTQLRLVDDHGRPLPPHQPGHIEIKGSALFKGYWLNSQKSTAAMTPDGYFRSGDIGKLDGQGVLRIIGRHSDMIISGGMNVYPKEVETVIDSLDGIAESAVIGLPHSDFGEGHSLT
ncbi:MAG: AMP-binding protein [Gammaproteobacteria bacterium]|nr:AMP-binding protein [Gammaproteobacteria bacterium]